MNSNITRWMGWFLWRMISYIPFWYNSKESFPSLCTFKFNIRSKIHSHPLSHACVRWLTPHSWIQSSILYILVVRSIKCMSGEYLALSKLGIFVYLWGSFVLYLPKKHKISLAVRLIVSVSFLKEFYRFKHASKWPDFGCAWNLEKSAYIMFNIFENHIIKLQEKNMIK